jgi:hypothetical protein
MSNTFKNAVGTATTSGAAIYTVPSSTVAVIIGLNLANKSATQVTASILIGSTYLIKDVPLPSGGAFSALDGKIILTAGQVLTVSSSANSAVDVVASMLEQA